MATAVLGKTGVLPGKESIYGEGETQPETMSVLERIVHKYRAMGYDAEYVIEDGDDLDFSKYLSEDMMKKLEQ